MACFGLTATLAGAGGTPDPLLMLVDDLQWCDGPSLRFLAYLATRLADLPVALSSPRAPANRSPTPGPMPHCAPPPATGWLACSPSARVRCAAVVHEQLPDADPAFVSACGRVTGGNPFLLLELLEQVRASDQIPDAETAKRLGGMAPGAVLDAVMARLGTMPSDVRAVAVAAAVLGDGVTLRATAELAGLDIARSATAADTLAEMQLLCPGEPMAFIHPLTRQSVLQSIPPLDRGQMHRQAAAILDRDGAPEDTTASHLLLAPAEADARTVAILHAAGRRSLASGAAASAVGLLRRALGEGVTPVDAAITRRPRAGRGGRWAAGGRGPAR